MRRWLLTKGCRLVRFELGLLGLVVRRTTLILGVVCPKRGRVTPPFLPRGGAEPGPTGEKRRRIRLACVSARIVRLPARKTVVSMLMLHILRQRGEERRLPQRPF